MWLTVDEMERLIIATVEGCGSATEDECDQVLKWAEEARINIAILNTVLSGDVVCSFNDDGEIAFKRKAAVA